MLTAEQAWQDRDGIDVITLTSDINPTDVLYYKTIKPQVTSQNVCGWKYGELQATVAVLVKRDWKKND